MLSQSSTPGAGALPKPGAASSNTNAGTNPDISANAAANKATFLEKVRQSNAACQTGDFALAISLYTEAIRLDPANHILYSNRSAAHVKLGQFGKALQDAVKAKQLNPEWPKVKFYFICVPYICFKYSIIYFSKRILIFYYSYHFQI